MSPADFTASKLMPLDADGAAICKRMLQLLGLNEDEALEASAKAFKAMGVGQ